ncbi:hypothetical protein PanWU01x14_367490 [Parasponia andersonii]|uniref:Uncharacterized protein n=1 Tax=Parasponia andersonii TaxID=3476 RepID=A0A2P5A5C3_PARAD|nr:hypothetical protein PanWU01x14_367490 [Parasponia andersonii]
MELCSRAGVVWEPSDELILPQHVLNYPTLVRLLKHKSASYSSVDASLSRKHPYGSALEFVAEPNEEVDDFDSDFNDESSSMLQ